MSRGLESGMSLIELMVGITVAALLMSLAIPSFRTGIQNRQIRTAAEAIQNGLQTARAEALRRNRNVEFQLQAGNSWQVGCETPDPTIDSGEQVCPAVIQARPAQDSTANAQVATTQLDSATGSASASPVFANTLTFTALGRTTPATLPAGTIAQFVVTNAVGGSCVKDGGQMRCLNVVVTPTGQIRMCDPAVAAGDMRAC